MARMKRVSAAGGWLACVVGTIAVADPATAPAPTASEAQPVTVIELDPTQNRVVCRRYAPTGSRISKERCSSGESADAASDAERDQARRDIAEMRMRQTLREQARAHALVEAMRRRGGQ